jgi:hypothetical protein
MEVHSHLQLKQHHFVEEDEPLSCGIQWRSHKKGGRVTMKATRSTESSGEGKALNCK